MKKQFFPYLRACLLLVFLASSLSISGAQNPTEKETVDWLIRFTKQNQESIVRLGSIDSGECDNAYDIRKTFISEYNKGTLKVYSYSRFDYTSPRMERETKLMVDLRMIEKLKVDNSTVLDSCKGEVRYCVYVLDEEEGAISGIRQDKGAEPKEVYFRVRDVFCSISEKPATRVYKALSHLKRLVGDAPKDPF